MKDTHICPVCGGNEKCSFTHVKISSEPLSSEDWHEIYDFVQKVYLPFLHRIIANSRIKNHRIIGKFGEETK